VSVTKENLHSVAAVAEHGDGYEYKYNTKITDGPAFYAGTCQKGCKVQASGERAEKNVK